MKKFLKENWFKLGIIVILLMIGLSIAYYFVIFLPKKDIVQIEQQKQEQGAKPNQPQKELKVGDEFSLSDGRKLKVKEVSVGNFYMDLARDFAQITGTDPALTAQVDVRIESENGPLSESDYSKMYITKGNQLIKLSNSGAANQGEYWFEMPKTNDFDGMRLHFGGEAVVDLTPYIISNNL